MNTLNEGRLQVIEDLPVFEGFKPKDSSDEVMKKYARVREKAGRVAAEVRDVVFVAKKFESAGKHE